MTRTRSKIVLPVLAILFLLIPLLIWGVWIYVFQNNPDVSQQEKVAAFLSFFPDLIQNQAQISLVVMSSALLAAVVALFGIQRSTKTLKVFYIFILLAAVLVGLLQLFMML